MFRASKKALVTLYKQNLEKEKQNIQLIIQACKSGNRAGPRKLYELFFSYGMSVALRYSSNKMEAEEILNDAFLKVFSKLDQYDEHYDFKKWFRTILINTSIDYFRKYKKLDSFSVAEAESSEVELNTGWDNLLYEDVLNNIQLLPPGYRVVFNLYAIEGYKHHEIAEKLNISVGTSKSNYAKARGLLQTYLKKSSEVKLTRYGR